MLYASDRMNKLSAEPISAIGLVPEADVSPDSTTMLPAFELASRLKTLCCRGVKVTCRPERLATDVTIDLRVDGPRGTFGIICDSMDTARILSRPDDLVDSGIDRVYCTSALSSLLHPEEVAESLARSEPGFFRRPAPVSGRRSPHVEAVRVDRVRPVERRMTRAKVNSAPTDPSIRAA